MQNELNANQIRQIYNIVNPIVQEELGDTFILNEDLSNLVDAGRSFANLDAGYDHYVKKMINLVGRMIFVDRVYEGVAPSVMRNGWTFGSVLEKSRAELPEAVMSEKWCLEDGASYDSSVFHAPKVSVSFWNSRVTYEYEMSYVNEQVQESFTSPTQMGAFISMIRTSVINAMTLSLEALIMRTINTMSAETLYAEFPNGDYNTGSGKRAVNLLYLYNQNHPVSEQLTMDDKPWLNLEFQKFASYIMWLYKDKLKKYSKRYNIQETQKFTPESKLHFVLLSAFKNAVDMYLQSDTFHDQFTRLPEAETIPYWQAESDGFDFATESAIDLKTPYEHTVQANGIIGVMFDHDCLGVLNERRDTRTHYSAKGDFWNEFNTLYAQYYIDTAENFIVFYIA